MWDWLLNLGKEYGKDYINKSVAGKSFDLFKNMGKDDKNKTTGNLFNMFQNLTGFGK